MTNLRKWVAMVAFTLAACLPAAAQSFNGLITGTVTDASGAIVPHAEIVITHVQTNRRTVTRTGETGRYVSVPLSVGDYRMEASAAGFKTAVRSGVTLAVAQTAVIDVVLEIGANAEKVEVVAEASQLESATSDVGKVVDNRRILELPLNTRNVFSLVSLTPGFVGSAGIRYDNQEWAVYGARTRMMEIVVDGISAGAPTINGFAATAAFPPVDAIQEFKVMGANPPAEYGRSLGTVLNIVYKSGTNQFHGSAFEFLRNSVLDANNFFANSRGEKLASFKRNQFGGMVSGPIVRNRTFFMASYEGLRESRFASLLATVPTVLERSGDFSQTRIASGQVVQIYDPFSTRPDGANFVRTPFPGNTIPAGMLDPVARNVVKYYPMPNTAGVAVTNQSNYSRSGGNATDINSIDGRVDHNLTATQRLIFRYSHRTTE